MRATMSPARTLTGYCPARFRRHARSTDSHCTLSFSPLARSVMVTLPSAPISEMEKAEGLSRYRLVSRLRRGFFARTRCRSLAMRLLNSSWLIRTSGLCSSHSRNPHVATNSSAVIAVHRICRRAHFWP